MSATTASEPAVSEPTAAQRLAAEFAGTFVLVFGVIGTALSAGYNAGGGNLNAGFLGVALALGLSVVVGAYAFGPLSGGHFNPAVTIGLAVAGRFAWKDVTGYVLAQVVGGAAGSTVLYGIFASSKYAEAGSAFAGASTGYDRLSPSGSSLATVLLVEIVATFVFLLVILGVTSSRGPGGFAPLAIGLTLVVIALVAIPLSNGSFNPARSIATAIYGGPEALAQLWVSIVAPIVGAVLAGLAGRVLYAVRR